MNILDRFNKNIRIRTKMIMIISGVLLISIIPLAFIILNRSQDIVLKMTFEVCTNLAQNISNLATEELLINETYDTTKTSISRLKSSGITGLLDSFVVNVDGEYVAEMASEEQIGKQVSQKEKDYYRGLTKLDMQDTSSSRWKTKILRFSFPISILYRGQQMRVGTAVFEFDRAKVYEPVYKVRNTIILVSAILFILGIAIAFYTAIIFSKPILKLSESVKRIGDGDLNHRIKLTGKDEIGQLAQTFNQMTSQIQDFTQNLENKVAERTDQLNKSLQEVQTLKIAQDGDYYLTSLLLSPLQPNNNRSSRIKTEFLIEQKKKFTFRKWDSEIGGDICITDTIKLLNKEYTVFINGDAMGKSIQGAGGALVLGVVFNAGLMRSRVEKYQGIHPEAWLKE
ncbi:MAG TPA: HAMP domain-containing protein, partial [Leptospiraceae bacterium]|nr:HAMP domain-containing protein [Leptospiraceae bacterium]